MRRLRIRRALGAAAGFARGWAKVGLATLLGACVSVPDFADPSLVDRPRVLAIVAEPPEVAPGEPAELSLLFAGAQEYTVHWSACAASFSGFGGSQYGEESPDEGCAAGFSIDLGEGERVMLPGAAGRALFDNLELASEILGAVFPAETVQAIKDSVGLPILVEARVESDQGVARAVKRVLVSENPTPHRNPPPPRFSFDDVEVAALEDDPLRCEALDGSIPRFQPGQDVELAPFVAEGQQEEEWLESYRVIDARGELGERRERAFYSWFATGGSFAERITRTPLRNQVWTAPDSGADHYLFVVVRDGHGGTSGCALRTRKRAR